MDVFGAILDPLRGEEPIGTILSWLVDELECTANVGVEDPS